MTAPAVDLALLQRINASAAFNRWAGFEVTRAEHGAVDLTIAWREEFGQYAGFLHAGVVASLIDTACGFAAVTVAGGEVIASHCSVSFLAPARGDTFVARARVLKAGRRQIFVTADVSAEQDERVTLVASGQTLLVPTSSTRGPSETALPEAQA